MSLKNGVLWLCLAFAIALVAGFSFEENEGTNAVSDSAYVVPSIDGEKVLPVFPTPLMMKGMAAKAEGKEEEAFSPDGGLPDLVVEVNAPIEVNLGQEFAVTLVTRNIGNATSANSTTMANYTICENPTYCTAYGQYPASVPSLNPAEYHKFSVSFYCYEEGYYNLTGIADYENNVTESNESNNQHRVIVRCARGLPDLTSSMWGFDGPNFTAYVGDSAPMTIVTWNWGYDNTPKPITTVNFEDNADWIISFRQPPFAGRDGNIDNYNYQCRFPGEFSVHSTADAANQVNEPNEENNGNPPSIICLRRDGTLPDLTTEILVSNSTIFAGDSFKAVLRTSNLGQGGAGNSVTNDSFRVSFGGHGYGADGTTRQPPLAPDEYYDRLLVYGTCNEPSEYRFFGFADALNNVHETNETNNAAQEAHIDCLDRIPPDLVTHFLYARVNNSYYSVVNDAITIPTGVDVVFYEETSNIGNGTALSSTTHVDTPQGSFDLPKGILDPNWNWRDVDTFVYRCPSSGPHYFNATADYYAHVSENNEDNNGKILTVNCV